MQQWRKSSHSSASGPECVEIALVGTEALVRDTKNRRGAVLAFAPSPWSRFLDHAKAGRHDRP
ncbi:DUF397 domain-containing protein [Saccharothrix coeruleofusca]|uniref:DUF397 domain-containing protein n=1 Tax=Saccharothrix coeruleofusca TaxID=33919 RepID=A0A918AKP0_9PSEU|nr:DUF397 domain-containing protein [Saccharothrix coeruleofusca]MBP2338263.1 hypothetical protein [Saccharothrix coeruleofusca]GGP49602.1 hypothetical protein GCM10010185_22220 [Saccharothrix coeruleofusca]